MLQSAIRCICRGTLWSLSQRCAQWIMRRICSPVQEGHSGSLVLVGQGVARSRQNGGLHRMRLPVYSAISARLYWRGLQNQLTIGATFSVYSLRRNASRLVKRVSMIAGTSIFASSTGWAFLDDPCCRVLEVISANLASVSCTCDRDSAPRALSRSFWQGCTRDLLADFRGLFGEGVSSVAERKVHFGAALHSRPASVHPWHVVASGGKKHFRWRSLQASQPTRGFMADYGGLGATRERDSVL